MIYEKCKSCPIKVLCYKVDTIIDENLSLDGEHNILMAIYEQGRADMLKEIKEAMYTQCFERNNDENGVFEARLRAVGLKEIPQAIVIIEV